LKANLKIHFKTYIMTQFILQSGELHLQTHSGLNKEWS
jgi:hypothetical protein